MVLIMQATLLSSFTILLHNKKRWLTLGWSILVRQETISGLFKTVDLFKYIIHITLLSLIRNILEHIFLSDGSRVEMLRQSPEIYSAKLVSCHYSGTIFVREGAGQDW